MVWRLCRQTIRQRIFSGAAKTPPNPHRSDFTVALSCNSLREAISRSYALALFGFLKRQDCTLRRHGTSPASVCGFSRLRPEKPHRIHGDRTALPKAEHANCVSPHKKRSRGNKCGRPRRPTRRSGRTYSQRGGSSAGGAGSAGRAQASPAAATPMSLQCCAPAAAQTPRHCG